MNLGTMFNAYPDSIGYSLDKIVEFLSQDDLKNAFKSFYILPTVFDSDIDRGFSIISYDLCDKYASKQDLKNLNKNDIDLMFDFILNHLSIQSPQFKDILENGDNSKYRDFFIDWNKFWENKGEMCEDGYIKPYPDQFSLNNLRKKSYPILTVNFPNGKRVPYWNTFYQKITYPKIDSATLKELINSSSCNFEKLANEINNAIQNGLKPTEIDFNENDIDTKPIIQYLQSKEQYLGQMDLNFSNPEVWKWYEEVIKQLADYGATLIRLDAFSRLHKAPARVNFVNEPETWDILEKLKQMAKKYNVEVLPEIHSAYYDKYYQKLTNLGCITYDYFLPTLIIDALDNKDSKYLYVWAKEIIENNIKVVNMLGCHDGIPMRDIRGLLPEKRVDSMIERLIKRGGHKKIVHGVKDEIYQMDMTYYQALGLDNKKMELARVIQIFMPGKPQVWYMDLLAEPNDEEVLLKNPTTDTREVNRKSYSMDEVKVLLDKTIVKKQIELLKLRNTHPAFSKDAIVKVSKPNDSTLTISWSCNLKSISLFVNFNDYSYSIVED